MFSSFQDQYMAGTAGAITPAGVVKRNIVSKRGVENGQALFDVEAEILIFERNFWHSKTPTLRRYGLPL